MKKKYFINFTGLIFDFSKKSKKVDKNCFLFNFIFKTKSAKLKKCLVSSGFFSERCKMKTERI